MSDDTQHEILRFQDYGSFYDLMGRVGGEIMPYQLVPEEQVPVEIYTSVPDYSDWVARYSPNPPQPLKSGSDGVSVRMDLAIPTKSVAMALTKS